MNECFLREGNKSLDPWKISRGMNFQAEGWERGWAQHFIPSGRAQGSPSVRAGTILPTIKAPTQDQVNSKSPVMFDEWMMNSRKGFCFPLKRMPSTTEIPSFLLSFIQQILLSMAEVGILSDQTPFLGLLSQSVWHQFIYLFIKKYLLSPY